MPAGRPRKPLELRQMEAKGDGIPVSHGGKPQEITPYTPVQRELVEPEGLHDRGVKEWYSIWDAGVWLHPSEDYHLVEQVARSYDDLEEFRAAIKEQGLIAKGYAGQVVANPLIKEMRACEATIRNCLSQLGFSPTARAKLGLAEIKRQSGLRALQDKTRGNAK